MNPPPRFRALLVCRRCGDTVLTGPTWSHSQPAIAAYFLGLAPDARGETQRHFRDCAGPLTVIFDREIAEPAEPPKI